MTQVATKVVQVIARIQYKANPKAVKYHVRSSNGVDKYDTTIYNGKATACTCPGGHGRCYHKVQCEAREAARRYDVVGAALAVVNQARSDAQVGSFYEDRAKDIERTRLLNWELSAGI